MGTAGPVAEVAVRDELELGWCVDDRGLCGGHDASIVITTQAALSDKRAKRRERVDGRKWLVVVIAGEREIQTGLPTYAARRKADAVVHECHGTRPRRRVIRRVRAYDNDVAGDGGTPGGFGVAEELDLVEGAAVGVGHDNGLVLSKVGRGHGVPLNLRGNMD